MNELENCVSCRLQEKENHVWERSLSSLTEMIYKILNTDPYTLVTPGLASNFLKEIHTIQKELESDPIYSRFAIKVLLSFSEINRIIEQFEEDAKMMNCTGDILHFPAFNENSTIEMNSNLLTSFRRQDPSLFLSSENSKSQERNLYRPFFMSTTTQEGIKQDQWTFGELKTVSEEGISLNIILKISRQQEILFVSPCVELVFGNFFNFISHFMLKGYSIDSIIQNHTLPFVKKDVNSMIHSACEKLLNQSVQILLISFKGIRMDGRGLLMEGQGIKALDFDGTIWLFKPIALVGSLWKSFDSISVPTQMNPTESDSPYQDIQYNMMGESNESLNVDLVLCHICERTIPALIFENHNSTCLDVHRSELDLIAAQDTLNNIILQLQKQIQFLKEEMALERNDVETDPIEAQEQKQYIHCLAKLCLLCENLDLEIKSILELIANEIKYAQDRSLNVQSKELQSIEALNSLIDISNDEFYPGKDSQFIVLSSVQEELYSISEAVWTLACQYNLVKEHIKDKIDASRQATQVYLEAYLQV